MAKVVSRSGSTKTKTMAITKELEVGIRMGTIRTLTINTEEGLRDRIMEVAIAMVIEIAATEVATTEAPK